MIKAPIQIRLNFFDVRYNKAFELGNVFLHVINK